MLSGKYPPVSLVRPLCGLDNYAADTLSSTFALDCQDYEILFCVASASDPVVPLVEQLIASHPGANARLLIGDDRVSANPKLNNVIKGWREAAQQWIIIADSNVLMPRDYIQRLFANWRADTGLVASPPIGGRPEVSGPSSNARFSTPTRRGGNISSIVSALASPKARPCCGGGPISMRRRHHGPGQEVAEDAAATKIVRGAGLKVRLIDQPLAQPLGRRSGAEVWHRQLRWARLRRASFLLYFLPEIL